jgi:hypothetical protein
VENCRYKILELREYKAAKIKKDLELTLQKIADLRERLCHVNQLEIKDFIAAEKSYILKNFNRLNFQMHKLYVLEDQYLNSEIYDRIMISICLEGIDKSEKDHIMDSAKNTAYGYSAIIEQIKLIGFKSHQST